MKKVEKLEREIRELSPEELADFRAWFLDYDAAAWDERIASDAGAGKLDGLVREARVGNEGHCGECGVAGGSNRATRART